jgi:hypothetical protein
MPVSMVPHAQVIQSLGDNDQLVRFVPSAGTRRHTPALPRELTARLLPYQIPGFRPSWLLTSVLDPQRCSRDELVDLYHRRWQIETVYREWKHGLDVQNLRSHKPAGVVKEVYTQLLLSNLVRWVMAEAVCGTELHPVDLSYINALTAVKNTLLRMLRVRPAQIAAIYTQLLVAVRAAPIRKRPGRSYPRKYDQPQDKGHGTISVPAKIPKILT